MSTTSFSRQEVEHNYAAAEEASQSGPVFITKDGELRSVLMDIDEYRRLAGESDPVGESLVDRLAVPPGEYFDWDPKPIRGRLSRQAD